MHRSRSSLAPALLTCWLLGACPAKQPTATPPAQRPALDAAAASASAEAAAAAQAVARGPAEIAGEQPSSTATAALCEQEWPAKKQADKQESLRCAAHWLRHAYGGELDDEDLSLDPTAGGPISTRYTAEQFLHMQAHVRAATKTACDDVDQEPVACRAIEYFSLEADSHQNLIDLWRLEEITPLLAKVLGGEPLADRDLAPASADYPSWSAVTLWRLRNAVFARHGRSFDNPDLQAFFYGPYPTRLAGDLLPRAQNPAYSDKLLSEVDRRNTALIRKYEEKLQPRAAVVPAAKKKSQRPLPGLPSSPGAPR